MFMRRLIHSLAGLIIVTACGVAQTPGTLVLVAGNGSLGNSGDGGPATKASLGNPDGIAVDKAGNLYIVDKVFNVVRKVDTKGTISTFAGGGFSPLADGMKATEIMLVNTGEQNHCGIAVDSAGNVYVADTFTMQVFKVDSSGIITIVAGKSGTPGLGSFSGDGGPATSAGLNSPNALAFDTAGNLYISDAGNHRIRKVDASGKITTVAGIGFVTGSDSGDGGPAKNAELAGTSDITVDAAGNLYIADSEFIRKVDPSGNISTIAQGLGASCYSNPTPLASARVAAVGLTSDRAGNLYLADYNANCVQKIDTSGMVTTVAGGGTNPNGIGGPATDAVLANPVDVALDSNGDIFIALGNLSLVDKVVGQATSPPAAAPSFTSSGVVNGADFVAGGVVPGEIATIFGSNLTSASGINLASSLPLATQLENVSVTINGVAAPIFAVDNVNGQQQINFQVPWKTDLVARIQVTNNGAASQVVVVGVAPAEPAIFSYSAGGNVFGAILHSDFKLADTADPAKAGETVLIYCTGLGYVTPLPEDGVAATGQPTVNTTTATIGGVNAPVSFSGLAPGFVGLYQVNAQVPSGLTSGNHPVTISISGATSRPVLLPVQ